MTMRKLLGIVFVSSLVCACSGSRREVTNAKPDDPRTQLCRAIASDIAALKPDYRQLREFETARAVAPNGVCSVDYEYHCHEPTQRHGGWSSQVPHPDADGVWFHIGIWDQNAPNTISQIDTQPAGPPTHIGQYQVTFLIFHGKETPELAPRIDQILRKHGMTEG